MVNEMNDNNLKTISGDHDDVREADVDFALSVAGTGWYNIKYTLNLSLFLMAAVVEPVGFAFVLPSAKCDLNMSDTQRGFIASIPYIGLVVTSFGWGYLVDTSGRKNVVILSSFLAGILGIVSAFMPTLLTFALTKLMLSLCIAAPAAIPFTFIGEIMPQKNRDTAVSIANGLQVSGAALVPLLAWLVLSYDFHLDFGSYYFTPWRLLTIVYALPFIISSVLMCFGPESPKYLLSKGRHDESLQVLRTIYAANYGKSPGDFPIKRLKMKNIEEQKPSFFKSLSIQSVPLLKPPYLKWIILNGILLFGVFATVNGLNVWTPDILNRVLTGDEEGKTACAIISQKQNEKVHEDTSECDNSIGTITFVISSTASTTCAVIGLIASFAVKVIGKKFLLIFVYMTIGTFVLIINFVTQQILFAILLSSVALTGLAIGPINAFSVQIFPTHLRGMAVSLTMMIGRTGSVIGANVIGILINGTCEVTFYAYGGMLIVCGLLSFILPKAKTAKKHKKVLLTKL
ncbi:synaptic vesicle glycoprotein 2C-like isoform X2 [Leptidea sinapis]|uniref:synaptic vesicle glycoprotein 2C-like isoform X2 n=2 Tax=Leptidea sinapis TaxID=189913 RepID=UPI00212A6E41|nr:synaptic vesicle glycoprotein 2C-like isoform X2 [Leptidea sinapis]